MIFKLNMKGWYLSNSDNCIYIIHPNGFWFMVGSDYPFRDSIDVDNFFTEIKLTAEELVDKGRTGLHTLITYRRRDGYDVCFERTDNEPQHCAFESNPTGDKYQH